MQCRSAEIEDAINYGESHLVVLNVGGETVRARVLSTDLDDLKPGDHCHREWDPANVHLIGYGRKH